MAASTGGSRLLLKLLAAYVVPIVVLLGLFGLLARRVTRQSLEDSLGRRLTGIAQAVSAQVRASAISFLEPGDEKTRTYRNVIRKLKLVQKRTGVERVMIFDRKLASRTDTRDGVRIGDHYYQAEADRVELERVFSGKETSSVLFKGRDGRFYKTGYAPLSDKDGKVIAAVAIVGSARFLGAVDQLATYLWLNGAMVAALGVLISVLLARRISQPLRALAGTQLGATSPVLLDGSRCHTGSPGVVPARATRSAHALTVAGTEKL